MGASVILGELSKQPNLLRKRFWLEDLKLDFGWHEFEPELLDDPMGLLSKDHFDAVLLDPEFSDFYMAQMPRVPDEVKGSGLADAALREAGQIWLRCFVREALKYLILKKAPDLDTHAQCYVTGTGSLSRMGAVVAIQLGYRNIVAMSHDKEEAEIFGAQLKKKFFGLQIHALHEYEMTLQPNNGSLLVNTSSGRAGQFALDDLAYLNY